MKEWMCWVLLILGVGVLGWFSFWLVEIIDNTLIVYYITVGLNCIVMCYNMVQDQKRKNR